MPPPKARVGPTLRSQTATTPIKEFAEKRTESIENHVLTPIIVAVCLNLIFFAGSLSWFQDTLPLILGDVASPVQNIAHIGGDYMLGHMPKSVLAATSHTSSFTVGCMFFAFLKFLKPKDLKFTPKVIFTGAVCICAFYFLLCFMWFSALVPRIFELTGDVFPSALKYKNETRMFDKLSMSDDAHYAVAAGSHTLSYLIGGLALAFRGHIVSKELLKRLTFLITALSIIVIGTRMQPTFIALCIGACATIVLGLKNHTTFSKMNLCYGVCITIAIASSVTKIYSSPIAKASIEAFASWWVAQALIPNLPFCEEPFASSPWAAQGASALAHMPYVPLIILALQGISPTIMPHLDIKNGPDPKNARRVRAMLWLQVAVQAYTGIGGHVLPNPRMIMNQEISIILTFSLLFVLLKITTKSDVQLVIDDWKVCLLLTLLPVVGFLTIGLMPLIFTSFFAVIILGHSFKGAFGRITPYGSKMLLAVFIPTVMVLAVETFSCDYLQQNVSQNFPWHLAFDLLFWQVVGSALDVVVITPTPGPYMSEDC